MCLRDEIFPSDPGKRRANQLFFLSQAADFSDCQSKNGKFYMYMDISASLWEQLVSGPKAGLPFRLRYCSHYEIPLALIIYIKEEEN